MTGNPTQIIQDLFGKEQLEDISIEELKGMVEEFPSFNALHYLLSKKLKSEGSDEFYQETERTALYFTNAFWLQWLLQYEGEKKLNDTPATSEIVKEAEQVSAVSMANEMHSIFIDETPVMPVEPATAEGPMEENGIESWSKSAEETQDNAIADELADQEKLHAHEHFEPHFEKREENILPEFAEMNVGSQDPDEMMEESLADIALAKIDTEVEKPFDHPAEELPIENDGLVEESHEIPLFPAPEVESEVQMDEPHYAGQEAVLEAPLAEPENMIQRPYYFWEKEFYSKSEAPSAPEASIEAASEISPAFEQEKELSQTGSADMANETEEHNLFPGSKDTAPENEHPDKNLVLFDQEPIIFASSPTIEKELDFLRPEKAENEFIPVQQTENTETVNGLSVPAETELEEELKFEPYHTIDYFASQGIKYEQEENPTDKFGKQLKSFTAWLKTMKRLPKAVLESEMNDITEAAIQSIAEHSIEEKEVITEAMAEVLVLQGKTDKAIELYNKLSLLNPSKSAFFAARIEQIKVN